jgi:1-acyl-sn-glycerol-3-phosphate acyltransferase
MLRTLFVVVFLALALFLGLPWLVLCTILTRDPALMYRVAMGALRAANRIVGMRVHVEGLENIPQGPCIFVANHASNADPFALFPAIPRRVATVAKKSLFHIPILSAGMRLAKFIPVDRAARDGTVVIEAAVCHLHEGVSFVIFAEGTRSPDARLRPFKRGAFTVAIEAGVPIVPVSIGGAQKVMRRAGWIVRPGEVAVRFGPAVDPSGYTLDTRADLITRVESLVAAALPPDQQPIGPASVPD